jgi:hypothetical protein
VDDHRVEELHSVAEPTPSVLTGAEAAARAERAIVGDALARDPAVAEGLALAGVRAASAAFGLVVPPDDELRIPGASCVHHVAAAPGHPGGGAFELAATSAQEAADHCLAAHLLSRRLGRPGLCSLGPSLADDLSLVCLPDASAAAELLAADTGTRECDAGPDRIVELAREALAAASEGSGRPATVVAVEGDADADVVLVAAGAAAESARAAARAMSEAGIPARVLVPILVRPFPVSDVRKALAGAGHVFALGEPGDAAFPLLAAVRAAVGEEAEVRALAASESSDVIAALREVLPECGVEASQLAAPEQAPLSHNLVVAPDDPWGEETARRALALLARRGQLRIGRRPRHHRGAAVFEWSGEAIADGERDLLLASHAGDLDPEGSLSLLRPGSAVIVLSEALESPALAKQLSPGAREALREHGHRVHWLGFEDGQSKPAPGEADRVASRALAAAAFAAVAHPEDPTTAAVEGEAKLWLRGGKLAIRCLDPADLTAAPLAEEMDFRTTPKLPHMPEAVDAPDECEAWARWLARFHRSGAAGGEPALLRPMRPAALESLAEKVRESTSHPFVLVIGKDAAQPIAARGLHDVLHGGLEALNADGREARTLADNLPRLAAVAAHLLARRDTGAAVNELVATAGSDLVEQLGLSDDEARGFRDDLEALRAELPDSSRAFDLRPETPLHLYLAVLSAVRAPLTLRFAEQLEQLAEELRDRLRLDRMSSEEGQSPQALASELGHTAARHLDLQALSETLPKSPGWAMLDKRRRKRIEDTLATIERHLESDEPPPSAYFLRPPDVDIQLPDAPQRQHPDPLAAAVGYFDGVARRMASLFRAVRLARMEVEGSYRPEIHDAQLAGLDWQAFTAEELSLLPAVTVVTTGRHLRHRGQGSLSELLRSSRPVHVIVRDEVGAADDAEDLSLFHLDLGQLVMAHRETFAVSSTLARPERLVERLTRMVGEPRPGVVLVPLPAGTPVPWRPLMAEAALQGRACPDFLYDPDAGTSWADRFDVEGNPDPECAWPVHRITYLDDGTEQNLDTALTFADAVALEPAYQRHLRTIPRVAWQDEIQVPLAEYVARFEPGKSAREIPFLWVIDGAGTLQRAVVTRELALACRDRLRGWRVLQELGGYDNAYAERAATAAREAALAEAAGERAELEQAHAEALSNARSDGARESMEQLAATLLSQDALALTAAMPAPAAPLVEEPDLEAAAEPAPPEEVPEEEEAISFDEPYIDTILCTSCNECTNINSRLFNYNADKQAFIADAAAGTFADLVKAAELCPAHCVHPGKPRGDDATATPELIARAAKFN